MAVRKQHIDSLQPYLIGELPKDNGEWDMFCPLHEDNNRSASLQVNSSEWYCQACGAGGSVISLIKQRAEWVTPPSESVNGRAARSRQYQDPETIPTNGDIMRWAAALLDNDSALDWLIENRGLTSDTLRKYKIGWIRERKLYTIPVFGPESELWCVRLYNPFPPPGKRKIWQIRGMISKSLYPYSSLALARESGGRILIDGGEWDTLINLQNGITAITRTGAEDVWLPSWNPLFEGLDVYVGHDADEKGRSANTKVSKSLGPYANSVREITLPYPYSEDHGKDWTDFWFEHDRADAEQLFASAEYVSKNDRKKEDAVTTMVSVVDAFDSKRVAEPVGVLVTIKGKKEPGYTVPSKASLSCDQSAGEKCMLCTMNAAPGGEAELQIGPDDPLVLELMDSTQAQALDAIRRSYGAQKCTRLTIEPTDFQAVEVLFARPSIDQHAEGTAADYKNIKVTSVGRHNTNPNQTVKVIGALYPNPRSHSNEFQAWEVAKQQTSLDTYEVTGNSVKLMKRFQTEGEPIRKLAEIAKQLSLHVTHIYGRPEMHSLMDLVWHSVISWKFSGEMVTRGWLEGLVVGDTQQGKSETARSLARHYQAGEVVNCEAASFAGVVGGLQTFGSGKEWAVTWGSIPINDRRLVVLEEVSGLTHEQISQMSDIRSSGVAKLIKIQQEETVARARLLWLGNPREAKMSDFTYGVQAIKPLIGNNEDIARFDLAMSVALGEVDPVRMNKAYEPGELRFTSEACSELVRWAWTRTAEQVVWARGAEASVFEAALAMGLLYVEDPPLVQSANIRLKIARVAVALAARLFSTDDTYEKLIVKPEHVADAVAFMNRVYGLQGFGYAELSSEAQGDRELAEAHADDVKGYLIGRRELAKFLKSNGRFRRQDIEEILNITREDANAMINTLWKSRMVRKQGQDIKVEPTLHKILREVK